MREEGIVAVGDISNTKDTLKLKKDSTIRYHSFIELYGLDKIRQVNSCLKALNCLNRFEHLLFPHH